MYTGFTGAKVDIAYENITKTLVLNVVMTDTSLCKKQSPFSELHTVSFKNLFAKCLLLLDLQGPEDNAKHTHLC